MANYNGDARWNGLNGVCRRCRVQTDLEAEDFMEENREYKIAVG